MTEQSKRVLIIDDDLFISEIYKVTFEKAGFTVETAGNGYDGMNKLKMNQPDIILLDILMPGESGLEVLEKIRKEYLPESLRILMLTNMRDEETIKNGLNKGANGYLIKTTLTPEQVLEEVKRALEE